MEAGRTDESLQSKKTAEGLFAGYKGGEARVCNARLEICSHVRGVSRRGLLAL